jgi:hypothetical protein
MHPRQRPRERAAADIIQGHWTAPTGRPSKAGTSPKRPDASVLNASIPLFFVGRNGRGLWVAREAEGRIGGIFLFKGSALRFGRQWVDQGPCATMLVSSPLELDIVNSGNPFTTQIETARLAICRVGSFLAAIAGKASVTKPAFVVRILRSIAEARANRAIIEKELFGNRYKYSSKNDDDLPIPR